MIIYSRFRLFLSCLCAAGTDPGHSARPVAKVCSVLGQLYNRPIWLFNGRLDSGRRSYSLVSFAGVVGEIRASVIDAWEIPVTGPQPFAEMFMSVVKRTIFLAVLEYLQYSDTEKCRKTVKKRTAGK